MAGASASAGGLGQRLGGREGAKLGLLWTSVARGYFRLRRGAKATRRVEGGDWRGHAGAGVGPPIRFRRSSALRRPAPILAAFHAEAAKLRAHMAKVRAELDDHMAKARAEFDGQMAALHAELGAEVRLARADLDRLRQLIAAAAAEPDATKLEELVRELR